MLGDQPNGYTILELMIVLAVSASMFVAVAIAFGGRQQQIQFTQSVRDLDARILDVVNDVSTGFYNNSGDLECSVNSVTTTARPDLDATAAASADEQGTSDDCVFIGKAIQFAPTTFDNAGVAQPDVINIYNIVGRRTNNGTVDTLQEARPKAVAPATFPDIFGLDSQVTKIPLAWGLKVTNVYENNTPIGTVGFFTSFAKPFTTATGDINISNNQLIKYGAITGSQINESPQSAVTRINNITDNCPAILPDIYVNTGSNTTAGCNNPRAVTICLKSADDRRRAAIVIGADGKTSTQLQFDNYDTGKCVG